jgi:hypothetical protein
LINEADDFCHHFLVVGIKLKLDNQIYLT